MRPELAQAVHVEGPRSLARAASETGAEFLHFGTNYVFDGGEIGRLPYTIEDEPRPINVYGKAKLAGEVAAREVCPRTFVIRTSWVYGRGKESFLCQLPRDLPAGKRVQAISDLWSSTTYVEDLASRIDKIIKQSRYGVYQVVNEGVCSYYEFAVEAGRLLGLTDAQLKEQIEVVRNSDAGRLAARPRYTPLRCLLSEGLGLPPMRDWHSALADYIRRG